MVTSAAQLLQQRARSYTTSVSDEGKPTASDRKATSGSGAGVPCKCSYLERASDEPDNPIVFDVKMNEYHLTHFDLAGTGRQRYSIIRYCPWCGGAAPSSKRGTFFAHITDAESRRLRDLASGVKTVEDAIARFGQPNQDSPNGLTTTSAATDTKPSVVSSYRLLRYTGLSELANVTFTDDGPDRELRMTLESKYIGEPHT